MHKSNFSRRSFLKGAAAAGMGTAGLLPINLAYAADSQVDHTVVVVFLRGGMDSLSALIPTDESIYFDTRPSISIPEAGRIALDGQFAMHQAMAPLFDLYAQGDLAFVAATGLGPLSATRSHFDAQHLAEAGLDDRGSTTGWLGRHLNSSANGNSVFRSVGIGRVQQTLRGYPETLGIASLERFAIQAPTLADPDAIDSALSKFYQNLDHPLLANQGAQALRALQIAENEALGGQAKPASYGDSKLGDSLHQIATLIRSGVGLEAATVDLGGWDLHSDLGTWRAGAMRNQLDDLSTPLAAFYNDINAFENKVTVVVMSEFGRRVAQNDSGGADHGRGGAMMVLGGGLNGGRVYGDWPGLQNLDRGDLRITADNRQVLSEIVDKRLGNGANLSNIFTGYDTNQPYLGLFS